MKILIKVAISVYIFIVFSLSSCYTFLVAGRQRVRPAVLGFRRAFYLSSSIFFMASSFVSLSLIICIIIFRIVSNCLLVISLLICPPSCVVAITRCLIVLTSFLPVFFDKMKVSSWKLLEHAGKAHSAGDSACKPGADNIREGADCNSRERHLSAVLNSGNRDIGIFCHVEE